MHFTVKKLTVTLEEADVVNGVTISLRAFGEAIAFCDLRTTLSSRRERTSAISLQTVHDAMA